MPVARCCVQGSGLALPCDPGSDWHWGGHQQPGLELPSCLGRHREHPGSARAEQGPRARSRALSNNSFSLLRKDVLVYQTELGMQIYSCNCRINRVNSCKIRSMIILRDPSRIPRTLSNPNFITMSWFRANI